MADWEGYCLVNIFASQPASSIATAKAVISYAGKTPTTNMPHEKAILLESNDGLEYVFELTRPDPDGEPTMSYIKAGTIEHSDMTQTEVDNLYSSITIFSGSTKKEMGKSAKKYMFSNSSNWNLSD